MGCNSTCSYCIVPAVRGREQSRRPGDIVAEVTRLAADGVREITLLGQNVNSWGRDLAPDIRTEFGELLRACDAVDGIERIRFTSPHPKDFREPVIAAMAECDAVCEHIHLPLQSGSTRILKAMRRTYSRERYLTLAERLRDGDPRPRARHGRHRRLPGRDRGGLRRRRSRSSRRCATTAPSRSSTRPGAEPMPPRCRTRFRSPSSTSGSSGSSRSCSGSPPSGTPSGWAGSSRSSSRARAEPTRRCCAAARDGTRRWSSPARGEAGDLVDVAIEGSTSTTLRGRVASAVPA